MKCDKYDIAHRGVRCIAVNWAVKPHRFVLIFNGKTFIYSQKNEYSFVADTDYIRAVIDEFLSQSNNHS